MLRSQHLLLFLLHGCLVALSTEGPDSPVAASDILGISVVEVPAQAAELVLARLKQDIKLALGLLLEPRYIALHIELCVAGADDGQLRLEQQRQGLVPLVAAGRVAETRVEQHKGVEVRIVRRKVACLVHGVEVIDNGADLHLVPDAILDYSAERIRWRSLRQRELVVAVGHALRADHDEMDLRLGEQVSQLHPSRAGKRRFGASTEYKETNGRRFGTELLDAGTSAGSSGMQVVAQGCDETC